MTVYIDYLIVDCGEELAAFRTIKELLNDRRFTIVEHLGDILESLWAQDNMEQNFKYYHEYLVEELEEVWGNSYQVNKLANASVELGYGIYRKLKNLNLYDSEGLLGFSFGGLIDRDSILLTSE